MMLAVVVVAGTRAVGTPTSDGSPVHRVLGMAGTGVSGLFLYLARLLNPITGWIAGLDLNNMGFVVVGTCALMWGVALAYWRFDQVERRWTESRSVIGSDQA